MKHEWLWSAGVGMVFGILLISWCDDLAWKREAIEKGFSQYNSTTGHWQWKTNGIQTNIVYVAQDLIWSTTNIWKPEISK